MPEYAGEFELHLTVRAAADHLERFRVWCADQGYKCTEIVLARGASVHQPMATWRSKDAVLSKARREIEASALEAQRAGFEVVRCKIEAGLQNADVPRDYPDVEAHPRENYFEHHLKVRRPADAPLDALAALCQQFGAHLSRNALRQTRSGHEERFVTLRSYDQGRLSSRAHLSHLQAALQALGERVVEVESEYCVFDSNLALDAGWLPDAQQPPAVTPSLPIEVCSEFLYGVSLALPHWTEVAMVLRGSFLLHHWFGDAARPPADLDLECFSLGAQLRGGERSIVDRARRMCWDALDPALQRGRVPEVLFDGADAGHGESLFEYGSPGTRNFVTWTWQRHGIPVTGQLQIDFSTPNSVTRAAIDAASVWLRASNAQRFQFWAYTREMQLAAKLSWLLRSFQRRVIDGVVRTPMWMGEPKDLFDVDLLLTSDDLRRDALQRCLLVVGEEDRLDWSQLDVLFDVRRTHVVDLNFHNWPEFARLHPRLLRCGPAQMANAVLDRLEPLLGDLYRSEESGFLQAIHADPSDETGYCIYADWLEERGDPRGSFLRLYAAYHFRREPDRALCVAAQDIIASVSTLWLVRLFRTSAQVQVETDAMLRWSGVAAPFV